MNDATLVLILLAGGTYLFKAAAPLVLGARPLPIRIGRLVELLPAALLAALAVVSTMADGSSIVIDARLAGLVAAGVALWRRAPFVIVVVVASAATALVRLIS